MQGHDEVPSIVPTPCYADVSHDTDDSSSFYKRTVAVSPDLIKFVQEGFVVLDTTKLSWMVIVLLEGPIGR